jgi:hypothetical protein
VPCEALGAVAAVDPTKLSHVGAPLIVASTLLTKLDVVSKFIDDTEQAWFGHVLAHDTPASLNIQLGGDAVVVVCVGSRVLAVVATSAAVLRHEP